jgi:hypothetical protein
MSDDRELRIAKGSPGGTRTHQAWLGNVRASITLEGTVFFDLNEGDRSLSVHGWIDQGEEPGRIAHLTPESDDDVWTLAEALRKAQDADPEGPKARRIESLRKELATLTGADQ